MYVCVCVCVCVCVKRDLQAVGISDGSWYSAAQDK